MCLLSAVKKAWTHNWRIGENISKEGKRYDTVWSGSYSIRFCYGGLRSVTICKYLRAHLTGSRPFWSKLACVRDFSTWQESSIILIFLAFTAKDNNSRTIHMNWVELGMREVWLEKTILPLNGLAFNFKLLFRKTNPHLKCSFWLEKFIKLASSWKFPNFWFSIRK